MPYTIFRRSARSACAALAPMNLRIRLTTTGLELVPHPHSAGPQPAQHAPGRAAAWQPRDARGRFVPYLAVAQHLPVEHLTDVLETASSDPFWAASGGYLLGNPVTGVDLTTIYPHARPHLPALLWMLRAEAAGTAGEADTARATLNDLTAADPDGAVSAGLLVAGLLAHQFLALLPAGDLPALARDIHTFTHRVAGALTAVTAAPGAGPATAPGPALLDPRNVQVLPGGLLTLIAITTAVTPLEALDDLTSHLRRLARTTT